MSELRAKPKLHKKLLQTMANDHYFSKRPTSAPKPRLLRLFINGKELKINTSSGVFSPRRIDPATLLLIENMRASGKILDLGCGYGPIGLVAASINPDNDVTMVEINERAAKLAMENLMTNKIPNALVLESDFFEKIKDDKYDTILMNPPMALGLKRIFELIGDCKEHLNKKGTLQIVARHKKGGERLEARMQEVFGNVEEVAKGGGFRVYMSVCSK